MNVLHFFVNFFILNCLNCFFVLKSFNINFNTILNILFTNIPRIPLCLRCQEIISLIFVSRRMNKNRKNQSNLWCKLIFSFFFLKNRTLQFEQSAIIIFIVRNYKYTDLIFIHGVIKYDNWLYKHIF